MAINVMSSISFTDTARQIYNAVYETMQKEWERCHFWWVQLVLNGALTAVF